MSTRPKTAKPARDARGRYLECGNLNGRPAKINLIGVDADPYIFANSNLNLNLNGETVTMTRQEALLNKLYQQAMKGNVRAIIYLDQKFVEANETIANARLDLPDLLRKWRAAPGDERRGRYPPKRNLQDYERAPDPANTSQHQGRRTAPKEEATRITGSDTTTCVAVSLK